MIRRYLVRYVILLVILIACAGAALYFTETNADSHEDAVLALLEEPGGQAGREVWCLADNAWHTADNVWRTADGAWCLADNAWRTADEWRLIAPAKWREAELL